MKIFNNLSIGSKIMAGYFIALVLAAMVGGMSLYRINELNTTMSHLADKVALEQHLADNILTHVWQTRYYALDYINQQRPEDLERYRQELSDLDTLLTQADQTITQPEQVEMLTQLKESLSQFRAGYDKVIKLAADRSKIIDITLDIQGPLAEQKLTELQKSTFASQDYEVTQDVVVIQQALSSMRLDTFKYLQEKEEEWATKFDASYQQVQEMYQQALSEKLDNPDQRQAATEAKTVIDNYATAFASLHDNYAAQNQIIIGELNVISRDIQKIGDQLVASVNEEFNLANEQTKTVVTQTQIILLITIAVAVLAGLSLGWTLSQSIIGPLKIMMGGLQNMSQGDLNRDIGTSVKQAIMTRNDEIGAMGQALRASELYFTTMAEAADRIAQGDLTVEITSKGDKDELGNVFVKMINQLRYLVGQVKDNAASLTTASSQFSAAAYQAGQATSQITDTLQQVAQRTAQQSEGLNRATEMVEQMARAIDGVATGAQEQATAVGKAADITAHINEAIHQVAGNAETVVKQSVSAADAAQVGAKTVQETIQGMEKIKAKVGVSAAKVTEMGQRSSQIRMIVETIDDIASQTNLLALNAAIEAARAGAHGKGFAVVADEVRKLAEKSAGATKEIADLIQGIQQTVVEAVQAMAEGTQEVETGAHRAQAAGQALTDILGAAEAVRLQAEAAQGAAQRMGQSVQEMVAAMETVSAVVEENTAAMQEMAANSEQVNEAIGHIARVGQENELAVEQVSAGAEEMNTQVEEVSMSAEKLSLMAQTLQRLMAEFKLSAQGDTQEISVKKMKQLLVPVTPQNEVGFSSDYHDNPEEMLLMMHNGKH